MSEKNLIIKPEPDNCEGGIGPEWQVLWESAPSLRQPYTGARTKRQPPTSGTARVAEGRKGKGGGAGKRTSNGGSGVEEGSAQQGETLLAKGREGSARKGQEAMSYVDIKPEPVHFEMSFARPEADYSEGGATPAEASGSGKRRHEVAGARSGSKRPRGDGQAASPTHSRPGLPHPGTLIRTAAEEVYPGYLPHPVSEGGSGARDGAVEGVAGTSGGSPVNAASSRARSSPASKGGAVASHSPKNGGKASVPSSPSSPVTANRGCQGDSGQQAGGALTPSPGAGMKRKVNVVVQAAVEDGGEGACQASFSKDLVLDACLCDTQSAFEEEEVKVWRTVKPRGKGFDASTQLDNLGLLRFVDKTLFSFTRHMRLYVYIGEVNFRGLLPVSDQEKSAVTPIIESIASELRDLGVREKDFVSAYGSSDVPEWMRQMITPYGLRQLYLGLNNLSFEQARHDKQRHNHMWLVYANSLFYRQKLGHHCPWTLQVTPPTGSAGLEVPSKRPTHTHRLYQTVVKTLTNVALDPVTKEKKMTVVRLADGGAGTPLENYGLSPSISAALQHTIQQFGLEDVAAPFCSCEFSVYDTSEYEPVTVDCITFHHITRLSFLESRAVLHCWRRNNGLFASFDEFVSEGLLPPPGHKHQHSLLAAAERGRDVVHMLTPELILLDKGKGDWGQEVKVKNRERVWRRPRLLINLRYLRTMYVALAHSEPLLRKHAQAKFLIKLWQHCCPREKPADAADGSQDTASQPEQTGTAGGGQDLEGKGGGEAGGGVGPGEGGTGRQSTDQQTGETGETKGSRPIETGESRPGETGESRPIETGEGMEEDEADDCQVLENVPEEEKEVIDLVESSCEEDSDCEAGRGVVGPPGQASKDPKAEGGAQTRPLRSSGSNAEDDTDSQAAKAGGRKNPTRACNKKVADSSSQAQESPTIRPTVAQTSVRGGKEAKQGVDGERQQVGGIPAAHKSAGSSTPNPRGGLQSNRASSRKSQGGSGPRSVKQESQGEREGGTGPRGIKQEREDPLDSGLADELSEAEDFLLDVPVRFQQPGSQSNTRLSAQFVTDTISRFSVTSANQFAGDDAADLPDEDEEGEENDEDGDEEEGKVGEDDVRFRVCDFPRSCSCPVDPDPSLLASSSIAQSFLQRLSNRVYVLRYVGQAVIDTFLLYTFRFRDMIYLSVAQLQNCGLLSLVATVSNLDCNGPASWVHKANNHDLTFLTKNGVVCNTEVRRYLVSAELLCFLSYETYLVSRIVRQSDIHLHRPGHLCPDTRSLASRVQKRDGLDQVIAAWTKSFHWQGALQQLERRRLGLTQGAASTTVQSSPSPQKHSKASVAAASPSVGNQLQSPSSESLQKKSAVEAGGVGGKGEGTELGGPPTTSSSAPEASGAASLPPDHAVFLRKCKLSDGASEHVKGPGSSTFYMCWPGPKGESPYIAQYGTDEASVVAKEAVSNVYEGAVFPKGLKDKNKRLKTGIGFVELDSGLVSSWIGFKSETHHIVLSGVLTTNDCGCDGRAGKANSKPLVLSCFQFNGKLYVNWGELVAQMVAVGTVYSLASRLGVFLYSVPSEVGVHFARHYGSNSHLLLSQPWVCVTSLNAAAWLGSKEQPGSNLFPKTLAMLTEHFTQTHTWTLRLRNFVLVAKSVFVPM